MRTLRARTAGLILSAFLALPGAAAAQDHHPQAETGKDRPQSGMMGMGQGHARMSMMHGMTGMMGGPTASLILAQKQALKLTDKQIERLEAIREEMAETRGTHMTEIRPLQRRAKEAVLAEKPDISRYENALKQLADHRVALQVEMARLGQRALGVLNAEQRSNIRYGMRLTAGMMGGGMMEGGGCAMMSQTAGSGHGQ